MPKKFKGENSKATEARAKKAAARADQDEAKRKAEDDAYWADDDKHVNKKINRKEDLAKKKADLAERKAQLKALADAEMKESSGAAQSTPQKVTRAQLDEQRERERLHREEAKKEKELADSKLALQEDHIGDGGNVNVDAHTAGSARTIDDAINVLNGPDEMDRHPEKRMKAAYTAFEDERMPQLKKEYPTLRLSQLRQMLKKEWQKCPDNPLNKRVEAASQLLAAMNSSDLTRTQILMRKCFFQAVNSQQALYLSSGNMGGAVSAGEDNEELIDNLVESDYIRCAAVEKAFRIVDRGNYYLKSAREQAYRDTAWKAGHLHLSAPCIYAEALDALKLSPGMSFLNLGSGTGYLSTLAGILLAPGGLNHGIELYDDVVEYAVRKLSEYKSLESFDLVEFIEPSFVAGNCLHVDPPAFQSRYDRVYVGAAVPEHFEAAVQRMLRVGGIAVMPCGDQLQQVFRRSENEWITKSVLPVSFASLIEPPTQPASHQGHVMSPTVEPTIVLPPPLSVPLLQELCRTAIRRHVRSALVRETAGDGVRHVFEERREEPHTSATKKGEQNQKSENATSPGSTSRKQSRKTSRRVPPLRVVIPVVESSARTRSVNRGGPGDSPAELTSSIRHRVVAVEPSTLGRDRDGDADIPARKLRAGEAEPDDADPDRPSTSASEPVPEPEEYAGDDTQQRDVDMHSPSPEPSHGQVQEPTGPPRRKWSVMEFPSHPSDDEQEEDDEDEDMEGRGDVGGSARVFVLNDVLRDIVRASQQRRSGDESEDAPVDDMDPEQTEHTQRRAEIWSESCKLVNDFSSAFRSRLRSLPLPASLVSFLCYE